MKIIQLIVCSLLIVASLGSWVIPQSVFGSSGPQDHSVQTGIEESSEADQQNITVHILESANEVMGEEQAGPEFDVGCEEAEKGSGGDGIEGVFVPAEEPKIQFGGFGGIGTKVMHFLGDYRLFVSAHGQWVFHRNVFLGLAIYPMVSNRIPWDVNGANIDLHFVCGGIEGGYILEVDPSLSIWFQLFTGVTSINYINPTTPTIISNDTMVIEPGVYAQFELLDWLHLSGGITYRFNLGERGQEGIGEGELDGPALEILVKFGSF